MALFAKRPCRLNMAVLKGMGSLQITNISRGAATPRQRMCEKRPSPESNPTRVSAFSTKEQRSPNTVSPAADVFLAEQKIMKEQQNADTVCAKRMRRSRNPLSVSFSCCSKNHDGLRPASRIVDALVYAYFENQCISTPEDVKTLIKKQFEALKQKSPAFVTSVLRDVHTQIAHLCERATALDAFCSMPVLLQGGGRGLQLQSAHRPHLDRLKQLFEHFAASIQTPAAESKAQ